MTPTVAQLLCRAARDLTDAGTPEFTEWDLTATAWLLDPQRFGMRGYAGTYPDHKRVYTEIMKRLIPDYHVERVRPSTYRLTVAGRRLADGPPARDRKAKPAVDTVSLLSRSPAFAAWSADPSQPSAAGDLGTVDLGGVDAYRADLTAAYRDIANHVGPDADARRELIASLNDFLYAMELRFTLTEQVA